MFIFTSVTSVVYTHDLIIYLQRYGYAMLVCKYTSCFDNFLKTPNGQKMAGLTGGVQGAQGTLFGIPYAAGSW